MGFGLSPVDWWLLTLALLVQYFLFCQQTNKSCCFPSQGFHTSFADSIIIIQEILLLKLLQFAGIKDKAQLRAESTEGQESGVNPIPTLSMSTEYFFERLEVEPCQVNITCTPASDLTDELRNLKTELEIPLGVPPLMDRANVTIGNCLIHSGYLIFCFCTVMAWVTLLATSTRTSSIHIQT